MTTPRDGRATTVRGRGNQSVSTSQGFGSTASTGATGLTAGSQASTSGSRSRGGAGLSGSGGMAATRGFSARLAGIEGRLSLMEMGARAGQISFTSLLDGDLSVTDLRGEVKMKIGMQSDGKPGITYAQGAPPPTPTVPAVGARQLYIVVGWDGMFADPDTPKPSDFARVDVHISNQRDFEPTGATAVGSLFSESVLNVPADIEDHWVRLVAVTLGDVPSPPTEAALVRPLPADKIAAESIAAVHLASEIILGSTIVAGDPAGAHMELNETGLRMVREDQTPTVVFSADEGNALITGSIQTALRSSGKSRIVFNPFPDRDWNEIRFFAPDDASYSSLFSSRDRNGRNGAIALQGPTSASAAYVLAMNLGENYLLGGVFNVVGDQNADGTSPFSDGLLASPAQTALVGGGGPFLVHNYKRATPTSPPGPNGTLDPFIAFTDSPLSAFNGLSVLQFHEHEEVTGFRYPCIRNSGTDLRLQFSDDGWADLAVKDYDGIAYKHINAAGFGVASSRTVKTDIKALEQVIDPLVAVASVKAVRFRRLGQGGTDRTLWLPDPVAPDADDAVLAQLDDDLATAREQRHNGLIPVQADSAPSRWGDRPEYGLIAEDLAEVAPDALMGPEDGTGTAMVNIGSLVGLLWGAVGQLNEKLDALTERVEETA